MYYGINARTKAHIKILRTRKHLIRQFNKANECLATGWIRASRNKIIFAMHISLKYTPALDIVN
jgi:hypothetical protein